MFGMTAVHEYADVLPDGPVRGRGAQLNPANRFQNLRLHVLGEHLDETCAAHGDDRAGSRQQPTLILRDQTRRIIHRVDPDKSPDVGMLWTVNPYRGCGHGCIYCYARPYHEYLGFSCGLDFETRIMAKPEAPALLRQELASPKWRPEPIVMSGITDCWQPVDERMQLARRCLEVFVEFRQPVGLITRNRRMLRDLDLIVELARFNAVHVAVSLTTLDRRLAAKMEPRASAPADRLRTIRELAQAGVPVMVMTAPVIPGLTDRELPALLEAAAEAGAQRAGYVMLRLPYQIKALFLDWLGRHVPDRAGHIASLIRQSHGGRLYDARHGVRHRGSGPIAEQIRQMFQTYRKRFGMDGPARPLSAEHFRRPGTSQQLSLF